MVRHILEQLLHRTKPLRTQSQPFILACICLIALAGIHCGDGKDRAYSRGSTVIVPYGDDERVLNPYFDMPAQFLVFLPLVTRNEHGELEGRLAKSWEHSPDYREWTYHLRTDVRWHDGVPVTAHDLKFTLDLLARPDVLSFGSGMFESITVLDDSTVRVRYPGALFSFDWWVVYYPKHLLENLDPKEFSDWEFWTHPVGNGPYRYVRHVPKTMMEFEANPDYYKGKPKIDRVVLKFTGEARLTELLSGNVDAIMEFNSTEIPKLGADPRFRVYHWPSITARAIYWQNDHPLFRDPRVRRALTLAINRRELLQVLNLPENFPIVDGPYTERQLLRGELPEPLPYDPARARTLLDAAGWRDRDGNGVRDRDGQEFRFTAIVFGGWQEMAVYVQDQLRRVGVQMALQTLEAGIVQGRVRIGEFEAAFTWARYFPGILKHEFGEDAPIGYKNAQVVKLVDRVAVTADPDARDRIFRELTEIFRADLPVTTLFPSPKTTVAHRRIQGLSTPFRADPVWYMEDLWLEELEEEDD